jgi:hypothetical protein
MPIIIILLQYGLSLFNRNNDRKFVENIRDFLQNKSVCVVDSKNGNIINHAKTCRDSILHPRIYIIITDRRHVTHSDNCTIIETHYNTRVLYT